MEAQLKRKRIGIFSGVFDPVHAGHVGFALAAAKEAQLDDVYFLIEAQPRRKTDVTHIAHRLAMAKLALAPYPQLKLLELPDKQLSVAKTLPRLNQRFPDAELVFLAGADTLEHMPQWPLIGRLMQQMGLAVGAKGLIGKQQINSLIKNLPIQPKELLTIKSPSPNISSKNIRLAVQSGNAAEGMLPSVLSYIKKHWLYVSPSVTISSS